VLLIEDGELLIDDDEVEDGEVDDGDVDDGNVLDGVCELLGVDEDGEDDGLDDVCANAPQHMPAPQRSVMILVA
jgi:hypothetical protein